MQYGDTSEKLSYDKWDYGFIGISLDDRGKEATDFLKKNSEEIVTIEYDPRNYVLNIAGLDYSVDSVEDFFCKILNSESKVVMDCTTLGVAEMFILMQILHDIQLKNIDAIYLEPECYKNNKNKIHSKRDFELSKGFEGYIGIPGHALSISTDNKDKVAFLCGYESERIERAFEDLNLNGEKSQLFFGVPAFHSGWEMNSFSNNIRVIDDRNLNKNFYYCGASNPLAINDKLSLIYSGLDIDERLFIVPIGTKPMALGACIFKICANDNERIALLYDHPLRTEGRSSKVSRWNLYNISL